MRQLRDLLVPWLAVAALGCGAGDPVKAPATKPAPTFHYPLDATLRVNDLQAKGTHNSYHVKTPGTTTPDWDYSRDPLDVQLGSQGVRQLELDTRYIAENDRFEVFHLGLIDEATNCRVFVDCLKTIEGWSSRFPAHHPILVMIEPKDAPPDPGAEAYFSKMEAEILSVWPRERLITPDAVKGKAATLREAITTQGWPTLGESRGKILIFVNNTDFFRQAYTRDGKNLDGRLMFAQADDTTVPYAAVLILNDALGSKADITAAAKAGFLVRTFSDSAHAIHAGVPEAALASGAHAVSTDYPVASESGDGGYWLQIPGGTPSRCNPVTAPTQCAPTDIEDPAFMKAP